MDKYRNLGVKILAAWILSVVVFAALVVWSLTIDTLENRITILFATVGFIYAAYTLFWNIFKPHFQREFVPHLSVTHEVSHRHITDEKIHIGIVARLRNSSKVKVIIGRAICLTSPVGLNSIEELVKCGLRWDAATLKRRSILKTRHLWHQPGVKVNSDSIFLGEEIVIEPGQEYPIAFVQEFPLNLSSIIIYTHFNLPRYECKSEHKIGWSGISFYNITTGTTTATS